MIMLPNELRTPHVVSYNSNLLRLARGMFRLQLLFLFAASCIALPMLADTTSNAVPYELGIPVPGRCGIR
jgi:hypothetical protein